VELCLHDRPGSEQLRRTHVGLRQCRR
jgi:hypothetical protein